MNDVLLDKNSNAKRLAKACNDEGIVRCWRLPEKLFDADDDEVLEFARQHARLLLTFDRVIAMEHRHSLSAGFDGILIVALDENSAKRMTRDIATRMLRQFKAENPAWPNLSCRNSVIELQPRYVSPAAM